MNRIAVTRELLMVAKSLMSGGDKIFIVKVRGTYVLWCAYGVGSGTTEILNGKGYLTDKSGDKNHSPIVRLLARHFPEKKVVSVDVYEHTTDQGNYAVFGGEMKPVSKMYFTIVKEKNNVVGIFKKKLEAQNWIRYSRVAKDRVVVAGSLMSGDWGRDHAAPGAVSYSRIPNINSWKRTRSVRFRGRVRREVLTVKGKYVIEPSEDGVVLWVDGKAIGDFGDDQGAVNAARRHYVRG